MRQVHFGYAGDCGSQICLDRQHSLTSRSAEAEKSASQLQRPTGDQRSVRPSSRSISPGKSKLHQVLGSLPMIHAPIYCVLASVLTLRIFHQVPQNMASNTTRQIPSIVGCDHRFSRSSANDGAPGTGSIRTSRSRQKESLHESVKNTRLVSQYRHRSGKYAAITGMWNRVDGIRLLELIFT